MYDMVMVWYHWYAWYSEVWFGLVYGMVWCGMIQFGIVWYGIVWWQSMVWCILFATAPGLKMCTNYVCWILYACDAHDVICYM